MRPPPDRSQCQRSTSLPAAAEHRRAGQPRLHDRAREALVGARLHVGGCGREGVGDFGFVEKSEVVHAAREVGSLMLRAHADRHEIERQVVLADGEVERGEEPVPALAPLPPAHEQDERAAEVVARAEALGVVARRNVHARAGHDVIGERCDLVRELVLGLGEEPETRDVGQHRVQHLESRVRLVVEARHHDGAVGNDRRTGDGGPEEVRREDHRVVLVGAHDEMVEEIGDAEEAVEPRELIGERNRCTRLDTRLDAFPRPPGLRARPRESGGRSRRHRRWSCPARRRSARCSGRARTS